jgi:hypothetical protein
MSGVKQVKKSNDGCCSSGGCDDDVPSLVVEPLINSSVVDPDVVYDDGDGYKPDKEDHEFDKSVLGKLHRKINNDNYRDYLGKLKSHRARAVAAKNGKLVTKQKECTTCHIIKPVRSSHCKVCDNCIADFDHHCIWLGTCIGGRNHRYFVTLLFTLAMGSIWGIICCLINTIYLFVTAESIVLWTNSSVWSLVCGVLFLLFFKQCCCYRSWATTIEMINVNNEPISIMQYLTTPIQMILLIFLSIPLFFQGVFGFTVFTNPICFLALAIFIVFTIGFTSFGCFHWSLVQTNKTTKQNLNEKKAKEERKRVRSQREFHKRQIAEKKAHRQTARLKLEEMKNKLLQNAGLQSNTCLKSTLEEQKEDDSMPPILTDIQIHNLNMVNIKLQAIHVEELQAATELESDDEDYQSEPEEDEDEKASSLEDLLKKYYATFNKLMFTPIPPSLIKPREILYNRTN